MKPTDPNGLGYTLEVTAGEQAARIAMSSLAPFLSPTIRFPEEMLRY